MDSKLTLLSQRATLARVVAVVANEGLVNIAFHSAEQLYYISPLTKDHTLRERFVIAGSTPYRAQKGNSEENLIPSLLNESDIVLGLWCFQKQKQQGDSSTWMDVNDHVTADYLVQVISRWMGWDAKLSSKFEEQIRCSVRYQADAYAENRECPTRQSSFITWEQSIVEGNLAPLHKCRMPFDPQTQAIDSFDFKHAKIAFMAVKKDLISFYGPLEEELAPLLAVAGIDTATITDSSEMILPVHEFQVPFLLSRQNVTGQLRLLPHDVDALAQSSTRTMTVPSLPGRGFKLSVSVMIGTSIRTINHHSAFNAVQYWTAGMLDPTRVYGLQNIPLEILPEVACANAMDDHLAVMVRWDPYHTLHSATTSDIGYAVAGALTERAIVGKHGSVVDSVFGLNSLSERLDFLREYTRLYLRCFIPPLLRNGLLLHAHGQNVLVRFSRSNGQLLGISIRDMSGTRFNKDRFELTTSIQVHPRMSYHDMPMLDLLGRAYFVFFVVHLSPLIKALDLDTKAAASFASADLLQARMSDKEASDLAKGNGCAVVVRELHNILQEYETHPGGDDHSSGTRELANLARKIWIDGPSWPMRCVLSHRLRADWAHRNTEDKGNFIDIPNILVA